MAGQLLAHVPDPVTVQQFVGRITGLGWSEWQLSSVLIVLLEDKHNNIPLGMVIPIRSLFHGSPSSVIVMLVTDGISRIFTIQFR
jgi:hypothetical protein